MGRGLIQYVKRNLQDSSTWNKSLFLTSLNSCFIVSRNEGLVRPGVEQAHAEFRDLQNGRDRRDKYYDQDRRQADVFEAYLQLEGKISRRYVPKRLS